jgi:DNA-binding XRE family transcriptional regulator
MKTPISQVEIAGIRYAIVPVQVLEEVAPELLSSKYIPDDPEYIPYEVIRKEISEGTSKIQAWREYLGLTQTEVAERMGVSQASFSKTERAKHPRKETLRKVAKALGVKVEQLEA